MFCMNCGKKIDDNSKFCQFCGSIVECTKSVSNQASSVPTGNQTPNISTKPILTKKPISKNTMIGIAASFIAVLGVLGASKSVIGNVGERKAGNILEQFLDMNYTDITSENVKLIEDFCEKEGYDFEYLDGYGQMVVNDSNNAYIHFYPKDMTFKNKCRFDIELNKDFDITPCYSFGTIHIKFRSEDGKTDSKKFLGFIEDYVRKNSGKDLVHDLEKICDELGDWAYFGSHIFNDQDCLYLLGKYPISQEYQDFYMDLYKWRQDEYTAAYSSSGDDMYVAPGDKRLTYTISDLSHCFSEDSDISDYQDELSHCNVYKLCNIQIDENGSGTLVISYILLNENIAERLFN